MKRIINKSLVLLLAAALLAASLLAALLPIKRLGRLSPAEILRGK